MVVKLQMRTFEIRGGGDSRNEIVLCNAHFHHNTAKKEVKNAIVEFNEFFDKLAEDCNMYEARILALDANMALFQIIPEMRSRGFHINLAAWYPWKKEVSPGIFQTMSDSMGIFIIGPCNGIRMPLSCDVFAKGLEPLNVDPPELPDDELHQPMMIGEGKQARPYELDKFGEKCQRTNT